MGVGETGVTRGWALRIAPQTHRGLVAPMPGIAGRANLIKKLMIRQFGQPIRPMA